ncbi:MAG: hypothetical protein OJJ54_07935 [Pseudonocardia sp.]|nr:hypothetical protein [Pseudonocardia sp.]
MIVDCDSCEVRGKACGDCVIGVLLGMPAVRAEGKPMPSGASPVQLDAPEQHALAVLADQGLVPRLRLVSTRSPEVTDGGHDPDIRRDAV